MSLQRAFDAQVKQLSDERRNRHENDLRSPMSTIRHWLARVRDADTQAEIFAILDEFRPLNWTDKERAEMSKCYVRSLEALANLDAPQNS